MTEELLQPSIEGGAYDTAWVASLPDPAQPDRPRFSQSMRWLLENQRADGSWGGAIRYEHDRIISSLSAMSAISRFPFGPRERQAMSDAQRYVWKHAHLLRHEKPELVGFELLLPSLVKRVRDSGYELPEYLDVYSEERQRKLELIPEEMLYSPRTTISHSLEFLGDEVNPVKLAGAQGDNGAIGNSPAATAFLVHHRPNDAALKYLERCLATGDGSTTPVLFPCEIFDQLWSAYHFFLAGVANRTILTDRSRARLRKLLEHGQGISLDDSFPVADADDTAVAIILLIEDGLAASHEPLRSFERDDCYASFPFERHASTGVNIHVLDALKRMPTSPERDLRISKVLRFLADSRSSATYWIDKWHISPYYATCHALHALMGLPEQFQKLARDISAPAWTWLCHTQNANGSWGSFDEPTLEETAYAVLALSCAASDGSRLDREMLGRAVSYLEGADEERSPMPPLWIDKCLYAPPNIVSSIVRAARLAGTAALAARGA